jgi:hypothetical protein
MLINHFNLLKNFMVNEYYPNGIFRIYNKASPAGRWPTLSGTKPQTRSIQGLEEVHDWPWKVKVHFFCKKLRNCKNKKYFIMFVLC